MSRGLLETLRGRDGRSLARALVLLLLVGLFVGGLRTGALAGGDRAFCASGSGDSGGNPAGSHEPDCCLAGATPTGTALASEPPPLAVPHTAERSAVSPDFATRAAPFHRGASARGPPLDA